MHVLPMQDLRTRRRASSREAVREVELSVLELVGVVSEVGRRLII